MDEKRCCVCEVVQPATEFSKDRTHKDGLYAYCRACSRARRATYYATNRARVLAVKATWYVSNAEKVKEYAKSYREANPEKAKNATAAWSTAHPEYAVAAAAKRRAIKVRATVGVIPATVKTDLVAEFGRFCMHPDCMETTLAIDHVVALANGGTHEVGNFQLLCKSHNSSKGTRTIDYRPKAGLTL